MKLLKPLPIDDGAILKKLAGTKNCASYPELGLHYFYLISQYQEFLNDYGDCSSYVPRDYSKDLTNALRKHFTRPLECLSYIHQIRNDLSADICPMCGSPGTGTCDHYLPQSDFPELSIFSKNLIPACLCNSKRINPKKGILSQRVLHPYFDNVMTQRLISCSFGNNIDDPNIELVVLVHTNQVQQHFRDIIQRTSIVQYLITKWNNLRMNPASMLIQLKGLNNVSPDDVQRMIREILRGKEEELGTPNSWDAVFYHGLLNTKESPEWICDRLALSRNDRLD